MRWLSQKKISKEGQQTNRQFDSRQKLENERSVGDVSTSKSMWKRRYKSCFLPWLWLSWQSDCFQYQSSEVQMKAKFYIKHLFSVEDTKRGLEWPINKSCFDPNPYSTIFSTIMSFLSTMSLELLLCTCVQSLFRDW